MKGWLSSSRRFNLKEIDKEMGSSKGCEMKKPQAHVGIIKVTDIDNSDQVQNAIHSLLDMLRDFIHIPAKARVMIKVNLCLLLGSETGATVDPFLVRYLVEWLSEHFDLERIYIAEADATHLSADMAFKCLGWDRVFSDLPRTQFLNLSKDETVNVALNGLYFQQVQMAKTFMEVDYYISFAKLKTHTMQVISGIMKNQFGVLPEKLKIVYHPHLSKVICDLYRVRPPDFCLVDGLIAQEGPGPVDGLPRRMGMIIGGTDAVATDHVCSRLMGKNPQQVPHLRMAAKHHLGKDTYEVLGCQIDEVKAKFAFIPRWRQIWTAVKNRR